MSRVLPTRSGLLASSFFFASCTSFAFEPNARRCFFVCFFICINFEKALKCSMSSEAKKKISRVRSFQVISTARTNKSALVCQAVTFRGRGKQRVVSTSTTLIHVVPRVLTRLHADVAPHFVHVVCVCVRAEIAWKWALKQTVDGSQKEIHGNRVAPSGI